MSKVSSKCPVAAVGYDMSVYRIFLSDDDEAHWRYGVISGQESSPTCI